MGAGPPLRLLVLLVRMSAAALPGPRYGPRTTPDAPPPSKGLMSYHFGIVEMCMIMSLSPPPRSRSPTTDRSVTSHRVHRRPRSNYPPRRLSAVSAGGDESSLEHSGDNDARESQNHHHRRGHRQESLRHRPADPRRGLRRRRRAAHGGVGLLRTFSVMLPPADDISRSTT